MMSEPKYAVRISICGNSGYPAWLWYAAPCACVQDKYLKR